MNNLAGRISALTPQQRALLESRLHRTGKASAPQHAIPRREEFNFAPLSIDQERLWFIDKLQPGNIAYNIYTAKRLIIPLDASLMERSIKEIVKRHEILRTTFGTKGGTPVQIISTVAHFDLPLIDLRALPPSEREAEAFRLTTEEFKTPFDLERGPLLRVKLLKLAAEEHIMLINMHHTVTDRWSLDVFERELSVLYKAFSLGSPSPLPPLPIQYADYSQWQRRWLQGETLDALVSYWKEQLRGAPPLLSLPTSRRRPSRQGFVGAKESFTVSGPLFEALKELSRREGVTMFMTLLAVFKTLLYRYTGQEEIVVGAPFANRNRAELEGLIGYLLNVLVLRTVVTGDMSFRELLQRVSKVSGEAYKHQYLPFGKLVEELNPERNLSYNPLYQVGYIFLDFPDTPGRELLKRVGNIFEVETGVSRLDLTLSLTQIPEGLTGFFEYDTDLFDSSMMARMARHFSILLEAIVAHPERRVSELRLLTDEERSRFSSRVVKVSETADQRSVHEQFEEWAEKNPDAPALSWRGHDMTYRELNEHANRLASYLRRLGVRPDQAVGILLERSTEMIVGILGILKAGAAYLPLDPTHPTKRLSYILEDAQVSILLTRHSLASALPLKHLKVVDMDIDAGAIASEGHENLSGGARAENLAYIIYTSGSTGLPKGVMVEHRSLSNLLAAFRPWLILHKRETWALFHSYTFDFSVWELWGALLSGGRLVVVPSSAARSPVEFYELLRTQRVSVLTQTPTALRLQVGGWEKYAEFYRSLSLRCLILGGEAFPQELVRHLSPEMEVWNFYGPTESTVWASFCQVRAENAPVPLGQPLAEVQMLILDSRLQIVPAGVVGELYLGGKGLARGYLRQPEMTAGKFMPHPHDERGARLYRTGDLARYLPDGNIEFIGRADSQIKLRGFRIELGEIEAALRQRDGVKDAIVVLRDTEGEERRLVAYVVPLPETEPPSAGELQAFLKERLPEYMVPTAFVTLEKLPLSSSNKVDQRALPAPHTVRSESTEMSLGARPPVEEMLASIWQHVLSLDRVSANDNFFDLGGHSLLATQIVSHVREAFNVEMPLHEVFESPKLVDMSEVIARLLKKGNGDSTPRISPALRADTLPLSFAQQRMWFLDQLEPGNPAYNISAELRFSGHLNMTALARSLSEIIRRHEVLRTTFGASNGLPFQIIDSRLDFALPVVDLSALREDVRQAAAQRLALDETRRGLDLTRRPLRLCLLRGSESEHTLLLTVHHIAFDAWSIGVFCRELSTLYKAFSEGKPPQLPPLPIQYADFAVWQRECAADGLLEPPLEYWKRQLKAPLPVLELRTDRPRTVPQVYENGYVPFTLGPEMTKSLRELSQRESVTPFMTFLAAFQLSLYKYTKQTETTIGTIVAGRNRRETEPLIGFFANPAIMRLELSCDLTFTELLRRARQVSLEAYAHQDAPFEMIVEALRPERHLAHLPLFQVALAFINVDLAALELPDIKITSAILENDVMRVDLTLSLADTSEALLGKWRYNAALFDLTTITQMHRYFESLLEKIIAQPNATLSSLLASADAKEDTSMSSWHEREERLSAELKTAKRKSIIMRVPPHR